MKQKKESSYKKAGVDIDAAKEAVNQIKPYLKSTHTSAVLSEIGLFAGLVSLKEIIEKYQEPVLAVSTDGVGTKTMITGMMAEYKTIGQCLVNHCVNDILCHGAKPFIFLDYIASDKLNPDMIKDLVDGMSDACRKVGCAIVGGEMAEMPGIYQKDQYDLVGTILGIVEKAKIIDGKKIKNGDVLLALPSSGLHTNGYSLARKAFFETAQFKVDDYIEDLGCTVGEELLKVHKCYFRQVYPLLQDFEIHGIAHITGGGLIDNIARLLPNGLSAQFSQSWPIPPVFQLIQEIEKVSDRQMRKIFNLGVGMVLIVPAVQVKAIQGAIKESWVIGKISQFSCTL